MAGGLGEGEERRIRTDMHACWHLASTQSARCLSVKVKDFMIER